MNQSEHEPSWSDYVDVTIVEFATHTAYLDPRTGTGYLVTPDPELDIPAPDDPFVGGLSLHTADWRRAMSHLEEDGWQLLYDDEGRVSAPVSPPTAAPWSVCSAHRPPTNPASKRSAGP